MTLALLIAIPLTGALVSAVGGRSTVVARVIALAASLGTAGVAAVVWRAYASSAEALTYEFTIEGAGSFLRLAADGLSVPLVALTALLGIIAVLASWNVERIGAHMSLLLALEAAVIGVFLAADLILFYVAWEAVLIPMFFLIGGWGHENRRYAAMKFFIYTFAGSALMLVGLVLLVVLGGTGTGMPATPLPIEPASQTLVFWLLAAGFLVKIPVVPLHTWLPDAHVEAPTAGSIMLAGVMLKMGAYGIARISIPYTPDAFAAAAPILAALGVIGIVYGAAMALGQSDLKRLVAYSSVAHMGFVVLGLASGTQLGLQGAMLGMVSHGLVAGLLFFLVGALYERAHTRDIRAFGGLGVTVPRWATIFVVASFASLGLPGLSGFPGEFASIVAGFGRFGFVIAIAGIGIVLAGAYTLRAVRLVVHGEPAATLVDGVEAAALRDLDARELLIAVPLVALIVALGIWPRLVTDIAAATLGALASLAGTVS
ncbi:MAG: NADH-quinone oxidoreductase subunit M [Coriobacteriia bacterium]|nr:NADH-quinone oxidoreductase subunit M [Coriobacteriia bacterium]